MSGTFNFNAYKAVWDNLDAGTQEQIRAKARWEQMSLLSVIRGWWPEIWARIEADPRSKKTPAK